MPMGASLPASRLVPWLTAAWRFCTTSRTLMPDASAASSRSVSVIILSSRWSSLTIPHPHDAHILLHLLSSLLQAQAALRIPPWLAFADLRPPADRPRLFDLLAALPANRSKRDFRRFSCSSPSSSATTR